MITSFKMQARRALTVTTIAASAMLLQGCYEDSFSHRDTISLNAGDAIATNAVTQTIDPWPAHAKNTDIDLDGKRAQIAIERYQKNKTIPPQGLNTSDVTSQSGSSGQGGAQITN